MACKAQTNGTDEVRTGQMQLKSDKMLRERERNRKVKNSVVLETLVMGQYQTESMVPAILDGQILAEETRADQLNEQGVVLLIEQVKKMGCSSSYFAWERNW